MDEDKEAMMREAAAAREVWFKELLEKFLPEVLDKMSEKYYSDCCWAPVELNQHVQQTEELIMGECSACGNHSGRLITQDEINRKIKEEK